MAREYWIETADGTEVSGPYQSEQAAKSERPDREVEWGEPLFIVNSDDAY